MGKQKILNLESYKLYRWRFIWATAALAVLAMILLFTGLSTSPAGLNEQEILHLGSIDSFRSILDDPVNPITRLIQALSLKIFGFSELGLRFGTVVTALLGTIAFFVALRNLYWTRLAITGTFLLVTSSWFLHQARIGYDGISVLLMVSLVTYTAHKAFTAEHPLWKVLAAIVITISIYTPLMIYLLIAAALGLIPEWKHVIAKARPAALAAGSSIATVLLIPLLWATFTNGTTTIRQLLNISETLPSVREYLVNISDTFSYIFWRSFESPGFHFDQLPMLEVFTVAMVALGLFQFERAWPSPRTRALFAALIVLMLGVSLNVSDRSMTAFLPFVYLLAAVGVSTLLTQWQQIFPNNPIARTLGVVPIGILLVLTSYYHYNRYFVAWQSSSVTEAAFDRRPTLLQESLKSIPFQSGQTLIITAPTQTNTFQYLQTRYPDSVQVLADDSDDLNALLSENSRFVYVVSGSNSFQKVQALKGDPVESQASSVLGDGSLFERFGQ